MAQAQLLPRDLELPLDLRLPRVGAVDAVALEARAGELAKRSIKKGSKLAALDLAIRMMDLTTLEGADTPGKVVGAVREGDASRPRRSRRSRPSPRSASTRTSLPSRSARLAGSGVKVASVATAFPSGQSPIEVKLADVREAVALGADEIDMVIDRGAFLSGRYAKVVDEIVRVKEACGAAHLKVILETGELGTYDNVRRASLLAIAAGADFIKTSTGKVSPAATLPVTLCMLEVIRDVHDETGRIIGMKPAGGIRTAKQAIQYLCVLNETLGHGLADTRALPLRRLVAAQRRADADSQAAHRRVSVRRLLHDRLMAAKTPATRAVPSPLEWEYAPAPEARDIVSLEERYGLFIGGEQVAPRSRKWFATTSPSTEEHLAEVALAGAARRRPRRAGGPRRVRGRLVVAAAGRAGQVPVPDRPPDPGALARARRRRVARRRQADQGVARRRPAARGGALLLLRGLGRQARVRVPEPAAAAARRRRPDHPVELPAADARVEDRARRSRAATRSCSSRPRRRR